MEQLKFDKKMDQRRLKYEKKQQKLQQQEEKKRQQDLKKSSSSSPSSSSISRKKEKPSSFSSRKEKRQKKSEKERKCSDDSDSSFSSSSCSEEEDEDEEDDDEHEDDEEDEDDGDDDEEIEDARNRKGRKDKEMCGDDDGEYESEDESDNESESDSDSDDERVWWQKDPDCEIVYCEDDDLDEATSKELDKSVYAETEGGELISIMEEVEIPGRPGVRVTRVFLPEELPSPTSSRKRSKTTGPKFRFGFPSRSRSNTAPEKKVVGKTTVSPNVLTAESSGSSSTFYLIELIRQKRKQTRELKELAPPGGLTKENKKIAKLLLKEKEKEKEKLEKEKFEKEKDLSSNPLNPIEYIRQMREKAKIQKELAPPGGKFNKNAKATLPKPSLIHSPTTSPNVPRQRGQTLPAPFGN